MIAVRWMIPLLLLAMPAVSAPSPPSLGRDAGWPQAVDRLTREKTLAEGCASLLKSFAEGAPMARVQGERLYARAKADMDGLIELLLLDLASPRPPADLPELRHRLGTVVAQRRGLCRHVDAVVGPARRRQNTTAADLLAEGTGDAPSCLIESIAQIWRAYGAADQGERAAIIARIGAMRWLEYTQLPAA